MKYFLAIAPFVALIAYHDAWGSVECPFLLGFSALLCVIIKVNDNERNKREKDSDNH